MTADEIYALPAGEELDAIVAQTILGWRYDPESYYPWFDANNIPGYHYPPRCSTELADAWQVVEALHKRGYWCQMRTPFDADDGWYWAGFTPHNTTGWNGRPDHWTEARSLPLAICRAALITMESQS